MEGGRGGWKKEGRGERRGGEREGVEREEGWEERRGGERGGVEREEVRKRRGSIDASVLNDTLQAMQLAELSSTIPVHTHTCTSMLAYLM